MNIIKLEINKIQKMVNDYIYHNTDWMFETGTIIHYNYPIILMNEDTLSQIEKQLLQCRIMINEKSPKKLFGCHIAIADWLPFGEVQLT